VNLLFFELIYEIRSDTSMELMFCYQGDQIGNPFFLILQQTKQTNN